MKKKLIKTIIRITLLVLVAVIIGVNIYTISASRLVGNQVPMPFGVGASVVLSGSMETELSVGDLIIILKRDDYEVGDVVVYQDGRTAVTHRIISITEESIITRGDANNTDDNPISAEQIKGEVVFAIPLVGYVINIIKSPLGTICILALAVFLLESSFRAEKEKDRESLDEVRAEIEKLKQQNKQ